MAARRFMRLRDRPADRTAPEVQEKEMSSKHAAEGREEEMSTHDDGDDNENSREYWTDAIRFTPDECRRLRDTMRAYGGLEGLSAAEYDVLYDFGIWCADQAGAGDVILSDWTPLV